MHLDRIDAGLAKLRSLVEGDSETRGLVRAAIASGSPGDAHRALTALSRAGVKLDADSDALAILKPFEDRLGKALQERLSHPILTWEAINSFRERWGFTLENNYTRDMGASNHEGQAQAFIVRLTRDWSAPIAEVKGEDADRGIEYSVALHRTPDGHALRVLVERPVMGSGAALRVFFRKGFSTADRPKHGDAVKTGAKAVRNPEDEGDVETRRAETYR